MVEGHRLSAFKKMMLRRICVSMREEATGGWRQSRNVELYNLYSSPYIKDIK
jgi:hypothetical protein